MSPGGWGPRSVAASIATIVVLSLVAVGGCSGGDDERVTAPDDATPPTTDTESGRIRVESESMMPALETGSSFPTRAVEPTEIARGDIVVFTAPPEIDTPGVEQLVFRVVALGGETIAAHDGQVYVNGALLDEPYLGDNPFTPGLGPEPVTIPEAQLWVMGDNRPASRDSRYFGPIPADTVVSVVVDE